MVNKKVSVAGYNLVSVCRLNDCKLSATSELRRIEAEFQEPVNTRKVTLNTLALAETFGRK